MIKRFGIVLAAIGVSAAPAMAASDGAALFASNCSVCHQAEGVGAPGQFPPLKNRIDKIAASKEGKTYLLDVVLNGVNGTIEAAGSSYTGFMPAFNSQSDDDLAAILTYLSGLGDTKPAPVFTAAEVKAERAKEKDADAILAERKAVDAAHKIP